jgi:hypothetical protein
VDAAAALSELTGLSSGIESAVVLDTDGKVLGSTVEDPARLAGAAGELVQEAGKLRSADDEVIRVEVELAEGGLFVLRKDGRTIAATTAAGAIAGIVVYDLRTCLEGIDPKAKHRTKSKKKDA